MYKQTLSVRYKRSLTMYKQTLSLYVTNALSQCTNKLSLYVTKCSLTIYKHQPVCFQVKFPSFFN